MMWDSYTSRENIELFLTNIVEKHPWFKAICLGGKVIGSITLDKRDGTHSGTAELGYVITKRYWGKGYTTMAVNLALLTGFQDLGIEKIEALMDPLNVSSQRVLEKNGFVREKLLIKHTIQKGERKDRYLYSKSI